MSIDVVSMQARARVLVTHSNFTTLGHSADSRRFATTAAAAASPPAATNNITINLSDPYRANNPNAVRCRSTTATFARNSRIRKTEKKERKKNKPQRVTLSTAIRRRCCCCMGCCSGCRSRLCTTFACARASLTRPSKTHSTHAMNARACVFRRHIRLTRSKDVCLLCVFGLRVCGCVCEKHVRFSHNVPVAQTQRANARAKREDMHLDVRTQVRPQRHKTHTCPYILRRVPSPLSSSRYPRVYARLP